jgi:hypothetical protein
MASCVTKGAREIYADGSAKENTWTTPNDFPDSSTATDKLDIFKPVEGRREVIIPKGAEVKRGTTPGHEGPYDGSGGVDETLIPKGLPPGSVGPWKPLP